MSSFLRRWRRILLLAIFFPIISLIAALGKRDSWRSRRFAAKITRIWARGVCRLIGFKVNVFGDAKKYPGCVITPTHLGGLDILAHASVFPIRFAAQAEMQNWGIFGWFFGLNQPIWIYRTERQKSAGALSEFIATMNHGIPLLVYPEGTSTNGLDGILPFKSTAFEAAVQGNKPVLPVLTFFQPADDNWNFAWTDDGSIGKNAWRVLGCKKLICDLYVLPPIEPEGRNRKELSQAVYGALTAEYQRQADKYRRMYGLPDSERDVADIELTA